MKFIKNILERINQYKAEKEEKKNREYEETLKSIEEMLEKKGIIRG